MCKAFKQLPRAGGVLDQPWRIMFLFELVEAAQSEREAADAAKRRQGAR